MLKKTREVFSSIFSPRSHEIRSTNLAQLQQAFLTGRDIAEGVNVSRPFSMHSTTYACMTIVAQAMASVPFKLWLKIPDESGRPIEVEKHPLLVLLDDPYPGIYADFTQFIETMALYLEGGGNAWIWPDLPNSLGIPRSLLVLGVQHVSPQYEKSSGRFEYWNVKIGNESRPIPAGELYHMKYTNPDSLNQVMGIGPLTAAMASIRGDVSRQRFDERFFQNGSSPSLKLTYTPPETRPNDIFLTDEQLRQVRATIEEQWSGPTNAHKVAIVQGGMKLEELGLSQKEMDFIEGRRWSRQEIASVFRIPVPLLNDFQYAGLGREGVATAQRMLYENNIVPKLDRLSSVFQKTLVEAYAPNCIGGFDIDEIPAMREDMTEKVTIAKTFFDMGWPINQINKVLDLGFEKVPWGDDWLVPNNLVPARSLAGEEANLAMVMGLGNILDTVSASEVPDTKDETPAETTTEKQVEEPADTKKPVAVGKKSLTSSTRSMRRVKLSKTYEDVIAPLEEAFFRRLHRFIFDLRKEMLQNIKALGSDARGANRLPPFGKREFLDGLIDSIMFDVPRAQKVIEEFSRKHYERAIQAGISIAAKTTGQPSELGIESHQTQNLLDARISQIRNIPPALQVKIRDLVFNSLRDSHLEAMNLQEQAVALREATQEVLTLSASRARLIARTEMISALNEATTLEYRAEGIDKLEWLSSNDEFVRDSHAIDGEQVNLGEPFSNGLRWPGDILGRAEEVCNCRCTTIAVTETDSFD